MLNCIVGDDRETGAAFCSFWECGVPLSQRALREASIIGCKGGASSNEFDI